MTLTISWDALAKTLKLEYAGPDTAILDTMAGTETRQLVEQIEKDTKLLLSESEIDDVRAVVLDSLHEHWSLSSVLPNNLDVDEWVDLINAWANRGMRTAIYDRLLQAGDAILDWSETPAGLQVKLAEPFLVAITEARYCVSAGSDDGTKLEQVRPADFLDMLKNIMICEGRQPPHIDLHEWDKKRSPLSYEDLLGRLDRGRGRRRSHKSVAEEPSAEEARRVI